MRAGNMSIKFDGQKTAYRNFHGISSLRLGISDDLIAANLFVTSVCDVFMRGCKVEFIANATFVAMYFIANIIACKEQEQSSPVAARPMDGKRSII